MIGTSTLSPRPTACLRCCTLRLALSGRRPRRALAHVCASSTSPFMRPCIGGWVGSRTGVSFFRRCHRCGERPITSRGFAAAGECASVTLAGVAPMSYPPAGRRAIGPHAALRPLVSMHRARQLARLLQLSASRETCHRHLEAASLPLVSTPGARSTCGP